MADSSFWSALAAEFTSLAPAGGLCLKWRYCSGNPGRVDFCLVSNDLDHHKTHESNFKLLAQRAGGALNESGDLDSVQAWYIELKKHDNDPRNQDEIAGPEVLNDGTRIFYQLGRIPNVCEASASLCHGLAPGTRKTRVRRGRKRGVPVDGAKLRQYRETLGMTQEQFAEKCGVSVDTIQRGEAGGRWGADTFRNVATIISALTRHPIAAGDLKTAANRKNRTN